MPIRGVHLKRTMFKSAAVLLRSLHAIKTLRTILWHARKRDTYLLVMKPAVDVLVRLPLRRQIN
jgi:hypothetical protein